MPSKNEAEKLARVWIEGWIAGKPDDIPLAKNFTHSSPFGTVSGREKYLKRVKPLAAKNVASLKILKTLGKDDEGTYSSMNKILELHKNNYVTIF